MSDYEILSSPGVAQAESEAVGQAVQTWLTGLGWTGPAVSYCIGYARARTRAAHGTASRLTVVLEMARETESDISPADQERLRAHIDDAMEQISAPAIAAHRLRIAAMARRAATEMLAEEEPTVALCSLAWARVTAEAMVLGVEPSTVVIGDPVAATARREINWVVAHHGGWSESDYWCWLSDAKRYRELVQRVETMLVVEGIGEVA